MAKPDPSTVAVRRSSKAAPDHPAGRSRFLSEALLASRYPELEKFLHGEPVAMANPSPLVTTDNYGFALAAQLGWSQGRISSGGSTHS